MKTARKASWIILFLWASSNPSYAQGLLLPGGRGLIHLSSAWNLEKDGMTLHGYTASYFKNSTITGSSGIATGITYWDIQGAFTFHYASGKHAEWVITQIVYQDSHKGNNHNGFTIPDDLILKLKVGSIGSSASRYKFGFTVGTRIPMASEHNLILEPYSGDRIEAGFITQLTYSPDHLIPESAFNLHINLGFWYHNDTGRYLVSGPPEDQIAAINPTTKFLYGIGFAFPITHFDFSLELIGQAFFNRPPITAYGREDFIYLATGIKYRPTRWISFLAGLDLRLSDFKDTTLYHAQGTALPRINDELANYPFWRLQFGFQFNLRKPAPQLPPTIEFSKLDTNGKNNSYTNKKDKLMKRLKDQEELAKERLQAESAEVEVERIREERKRLEAIIARLRKILDFQVANEEVEKEEKSKEIVEKKP